MKIGYARISTDEQSLDLQIDALTDCDLIYREIESGSVCDRPILSEAIDQVQAGDTFVVWRLDRLGRSLKHLIELIELLKGKGVEFRSITENIDTATPAGELIFHIFGAIAQFERQLLLERCHAGIAAAKRKGIHCGRPPMAPRKFRAIDKLVLAGHSISTACKEVGVNRATYYRHKRRQSIETVAS